MCEEILRARHKLLADGGNESNRMESVIRLLEQTYERLTQDPELNARDLVSRLRNDTLFRYDNNFSKGKLDRFFLSWPPP